MDQLRGKRSHKKERISSETCAKLDFSKALHTEAFLALLTVQHKNETIFLI